MTWFTFDVELRKTVQPNLSRNTFVDTLGKLCFVRRILLEISERLLCKDLRQIQIDRTIPQLRATSSCNTNLEKHEVDKWTPSTRTNAQSKHVVLLPNVRKLIGYPALINLCGHSQTRTAVHFFHRSPQSWTHPKATPQTRSDPQ